MSEIILPQFIPETFTPHWIENLNSDDYHADKTAVGSSSVKLIEEKSPATFYYNYTTPQKKPTAAMLLGSRVHMALLEPEKFKIQYVRDQEFIGLTKQGKPSKNCDDAREQREVWLKTLSPGVEPISGEEFEQIEGMVESILRHHDAAALLKIGSREVSGYYRDPGTGIKCKIRPDQINMDLMSLVDLKTTENCTIDSFRQTIKIQNYAMQCAMYVTGTEIILGKKVQFPVYIAIEKQPPFEVGVYYVGKGMLRKGMDAYRRSMDRLAHCLKNNRFPPYQNKLTEIELSDWDLKQMETYL